MLPLSRRAETVRRADLQIPALPVSVLVVTAGYAAYRAVLSAGEIDLLQGPSSLLASAAAPGHALRPVAAVIGSASTQLFGGNALALRLPAVALSLALLSGVLQLAARRGSPEAGVLAALALLGTGSFAQFIDAQLPVLPAALIVFALASADAIEDARSGPVVAFALCATVSILLDAAYVFPALAVCVAILLHENRRRSTVVAVIAVVLVGAIVGTRAVMASGSWHDWPARFTSPTTVLLQPVYATAFLQSAYGRALGLLAPVMLLLFALPARSRVAKTAAIQPSTRRLTGPLLLATLPLWAFAPAWTLGRNITTIDLIPVSVGCCVLVGMAADALGATLHRVSFAVAVAVLAVIAGASATMRDPTVTLKRDLEQHRSRFALLDWTRELDGDLPIVVANHDVFVQLTHYAPAPLARRLAFLDATSPDANAFVDGHPAFYVFEGAEVRSPLFGWLVQRGLTLSESRSFVPPDQSIDAAAYLYRVDLD